MTTVILALAGLGNEPDLVRAAQSTGLDVVRRCVDAADLLGAAAGDPACPVVIAATLPRLAPDVVSRLGDRVVIGSQDGRVSMLRFDTGEQVWSYLVGSPVSAPTAVVDGWIVAVAEDGGVSAFGEAPSR